MQEKDDIHSDCLGSLQMNTMDPAADREFGKAMTPLPSKLTDRLALTGLITAIARTLPDKNLVSSCSRAQNPSEPVRLP